MCPTAKLCPWWKGAEFPFHSCTRQCSQNWFASFAPRLKTTIAMFAKKFGVNATCQQFKETFCFLRKYTKHKQQSFRDCRSTGHAEALAMHQLWPNSTNMCDNPMVMAAARCFISKEACYEDMYWACGWPQNFGGKRIGQVSEFALASRWCGRKVVHPIIQRY